MKIVRMTSTPCEPQDGGNLHVIHDKRLLPHMSDKQKIFLTCYEARKYASIFDDVIPPPKYAKILTVNVIQVNCYCMRAQVTQNLIFHFTSENIKV